MKIVVTHLTRMAPGFICVAGVDVSTGAHIRPKVEHRMSERLLRRHGGPFDIGALVDLGETYPAGSPPMLEDHGFSVGAARCQMDVHPEVFWQLLSRVALPDLTAIFGSGLERRGPSYTRPTQTGSASLGCLIPTSVRLSADGDPPKLRLHLADPTGEINLPLTDLRFYHVDHQTPRLEVVREVSGRLERGVPALICVGLGQPYRALGDPAYRHWLQANNLHLQDYLVWQERTLVP